MWTYNIYVLTYVSTIDGEGGASERLKEDALRNYLSREG